VTIEPVLGAGFGQARTADRPNHTSPAPSTDKIIQHELRPAFERG
jgi:hypothetical protein